MYDQSGLRTPSMQALLENKLMLDHAGGDGAGKGKYSGHFLCATVSDEELPWDINVKDY